MNITDLKTHHLLKAFTFILLFFTLSLSAKAQEDLLPPEQAFALKAWIENDQVIAQYKIAEDYYLYRDSISFTVDTENVEFGVPTASEGKIKNDEFFGKVEIYRKKALITLPLNYAQTKPKTIVIKTSSQGCADIGVCYPPLYQTLTMDTDSSSIVKPVAYQYSPEPQNVASQGILSMNNMLSQLSNVVTADNISNTVDKVKDKVAPALEPIKEALSETTSSSSDDSGMDPLGLLQSLGSDLGLVDEDEIPAPDDAFRLTATIDSNNIVQTSIEIHRSTYLYKDKVKVKIIDGLGHITGAMSLPKGDQKHDEFFGDIVVYHDQVKSSIPVITEPGASAQLVISYGYQGCVEDKICYPPITKYLLVDVNAKTVSISDQKPTISSAKATSFSDIKRINATNPEAQTQASNPAPSATQSTSQAEPAESEQDRFAQIIANDSIFIILGSFFIAGLLLTFTPCVFPMIPILSGIIAGQGDNITTKKAFTLSLVYVLAMASTYAIAGAIVGRFGAEYNIQAWFQDPVILSVFAGIFVLLALSMFGFYDIQMPSFIQSRLTEFSNKQAGGNLIGVGIMGLLSALIVGPCITAPLVGALIFISQTQDWQLGGLALFALGIGMGTPLLLIGTSAGKFLPRAGTWMDSVKAVFGVSLLAVAIWMLSRILSSEVVMGLVAALLIIYGNYIYSNDNNSGWSRIGKGIGFILMFYGALYLVGIAAGGKDVVQPLKGIISVSGGSSASAEPSHISFQRIKGIDGLNQALQQNKGKIVMLDFYADWCISCIEMEKYAFTHPDVLKALKGVTTLQTDVTPNDSTDTKFMSSIGIYGPPAILFYDRNGIEIPKTRVVGEMSGEEFAAHIITVLNKAK